MPTAIDKYPELAEQVEETLESVMKWLKTYLTAAGAPHVYEIVETLRIADMWLTVDTTDTASVLDWLKSSAKNLEAAEAWLSEQVEA